MKNTISKRHLQIVKLAGEISEVPFVTANSLGFMSRLLLMVNLPYRDPGIETRSWWRKNGNVSLDIVPAYKDGKCVGLPYGSYPRLILAYLITQAVRTKSPEIFLGKTFREFLKLLNINDGGKQYRQLQKQLERTLSASFSWTYKNEQMWSRTNIQVSHQSQLWWNPKLRDQQSLWESYIKLNTDFFNEITRRAVPLDFRVLRVLKNSPLGLDLYMFIAWRVFNLQKSVHISWKSLHDQLGGQYVDINVFSRDCRKHLKRIQAIWPELNIKPVTGRLYIAPTSRVLISCAKNLT